MTDITDLAQLRAELSNPANGSKDHLRKLALLLVEALEKAQRANAAQDDHINQQQDRINKLEEGCKHAAKRINSWRRLAKQSIAEQEKCVDELDATRQRIVELDRKNCELDSLTQRWAVERAENAERIAELESRTVTVKLASRRLPSDYVDGEFSNDDLAAIHNACRLECKVSVEKYLSAHGIVVKWEAE